MLLLSPAFNEAIVLSFRSVPSWSKIAELADLGGPRNAFVHHDAELVSCWIENQLLGRYHAGAAQSCYSQLASIILPANSAARVNNCILTSLTVGRSSECGPSFPKRSTSSARA